MDDGELDDGLLADLDAALDAGQPAKQQEPAAVEGETAEQADERLYRRDGRRFAAVEDKDKKDAPSAAGAKEEPAQAQPAAKVWKPVWYKDEFGPWDALGEPLRNALREQERNAAQAIEQHSTKAKAWAPVEQALAPHMQELQQAGVSPTQYVGNLIEADKYLRRDPIAALDWLAQSYLGADLIAVAEHMRDKGGGYQAPDPVQQKIAALEQQVQQLAQLPKQQQTAALQTQIAEWAKDKPHFADVRQHMQALAANQPEASLDDLYEQATWAHPQIRARTLQEQEDKRLADLKRTRAAGAQSPRGVPYSNGAAHAKPTMSLEDEIAMHLDGGV